ncbi:hypothetical protein G4B88_015907 [Cannabis sativa]|uniref:Wax synthase domain-containing protein n=1 Tax=Cannabis sativa TaxID=3483 RepID=A0A7J6DTP5_CANSA|nr:hypothetical protein G4B88_015907 [Cannabis sativa]
MEGEIESFIKVWIIAILCFSYCYYISSRLPKGITRLLSLLPVFYLLIILPLDLHSFHLGAPTTFFLVWLATSKLLLFSFGKGPLSSSPSKNIFHFIAIASLPIKIRQNPPQKFIKNTIIKENNTNPFDPNGSRLPKSILVAIKVLHLALIIKTYEYRAYLHPYLTLLLYCLHMYIGIETVLALVALPARTIFGFELEPQFNEPYLTTSLQDFWGRRWNLMVSSVLRETAYDPIRRASLEIIGPKWAQFLGVMSSFVVSGLMHEAIYYYLSRARPTWEVTLFFLIQGASTGIEIAAKKAAGDTWRPHKVVTRVLTLGFLTLTGNWLFFPQLLRNGVHEKGIKEYSLIIDFVKAGLRYHS